MMGALAQRGNGVFVAVAVLAIACNNFHSVNGLQNRSRTNLNVTISNLTSTLRPLRKDIDLPTQGAAFRPVLLGALAVQTTFACLAFRWRIPCQRQPGCHTPAMPPTCSIVAAAWQALPLNHSDSLGMHHFATWRQATDNASPARLHKWACVKPVAWLLRLIRAPKLLQARVLRRRLYTAPTSRMATGRWLRAWERLCCSRRWRVPTVGPVTPSHTQ